MRKLTHRMATYNKYVLKGMRLISCSRIHNILYQLTWVEICRSLMYKTSQNFLTSLVCIRNEIHWAAVLQRWIQVIECVFLISPLQICRRFQASPVPVSRGWQLSWSVDSSPKLVQMFYFPWIWVRVRAAFDTADMAFAESFLTHGFGQCRRKMLKPRENVCNVWAAMPASTMHRIDCSRKLSVCVSLSVSPIRFSKTSRARGRGDHCLARVHAHTAPKELARAHFIGLNEAESSCFWVS